MSNQTYIVATAHPWNRSAFEDHLVSLPGTWRLISAGEELTVDLVAALRPRYIFFPHWSHRVPKEILDAAECVCFHAADVPYGRGGSPIQNLIARGHRETMVTALRMVEELDAGPVYMKRPMSLEGLGEEIFVRLAGTVTDMIREIAATEPAPMPQEGEPVVFRRRKPEQSRLPGEAATLGELFDHLRMLDVEGYPRAFLDVGEFRLELSRPALRAGHIDADVRITRRR
ncbi:MAG: formyltransferase family protein [Pseudomonadota bacterium]